MGKYAPPCIYKATSKTTGLSYIGQSIKGLADRRQKHLYAMKKCLFYNLTKFHRALYVLGKEDFEWSVLYEITNRNLSIQQIIDILNDKEIEYVNLYNSIEEGYNDKEAGGNFVRTDRRDEKYLHPSERLKEKRLQKKIQKAKQKWLALDKKLKESKKKKKRTEPLCKKKPKRLNPKGGDAR